MFIGEHGQRNGKKRLIAELADNSKYKVTVQCSVCRKVRAVAYLSVVKAGHHMCRGCANTEKNSKNLINGSKYGKLTVVDGVARNRKVTCACECGADVDVPKYNLVSGKTKSCGCIKVYNFKGLPRARGKQHGRWKGGISSLRSRIMATQEYKYWREQVFIRDNYTCQKCHRVGRTLNAHHIESFARNKKLWFEVANGATLCDECHNELHRNYGLFVSRNDFNSHIKEAI